jgi:MFS transporter, AAHS family, 3-hydroxyphenylpropionic acid transporter
MPEPIPSDAGRWFTVLLLWIAGICAAMQFAKMSVGFSAFQDAFSVDAASVSALMAATGFFGLLLGVSGASITSYIGLRPMLLWALFAAAALSLAETQMPPLPIFYALRLFEGATNLIIVVAAPTLISQQAPPRHIPIAMGLWGTFYGVAFALTGLVGPSLIALAGPKGLLFAHSLFALTAALLLSARRLIQVPIVTRLRWQGIVPAMYAQLRANALAYRHVHTALPGIVFFFHSSMYLGFLIFVPLAAHSASITELLLVTMPLISILGTMLAGPLAQTAIPPARILVLGFGIVAVLAFALLPAASPRGSELLFCLLANTMIFVSGVIQGSIFILTPRLASEPSDKVLAFGVVAQLGSFGSIIGPMMFSAVILRNGLLGFAMLVALAAALGSTVAAVGLRKRAPPNKHELTNVLGQ